METKEGSQFSNKKAMGIRVEANVEHLSMHIGSVVIDDQNTLKVFSLPNNEMTPTSKDSTENVTKDLPQTLTKPHLVDPLVNFSGKSHNSLKDSLNQQNFNIVRKDFDTAPKKPSSVKKSSSESNFLWREQARHNKKSYLEKQWEKIFNRTQMDGEITISYFFDKLALCQTVNLDFEETRKQILFGLTSNLVFIQTISKSHNNEQDLLYDILKTEELISERIRIRNRQYRFTNNESCCKKTLHLQKDEVSLKQENCDEKKKKDKVCFRCGGTGHFAEECQNQKRIICYRCQEEGHVASGCSIKNKHTKKKREDIKQE